MVSHPTIISFMVVATLVGELGLEPRTSWSQTRRASQLRYTPTHLKSIPFFLFPCEYQKYGNAMRNGSVVQKSSYFSGEPMKSHRKAYTVTMEKYYSQSIGTEVFTIEGAREGRALPDEPIQVRRANDRVPQGGDRVGPLVVAEQEDDVGARRGFRPGRNR